MNHPNLWKIIGKHPWESPSIRKNGGFCESIRFVRVFRVTGTLRSHSTTSASSRKNRPNSNNPPLGRPPQGARGPSLTVLTPAIPSQTSTAGDCSCNVPSISLKSGPLLPGVGGLSPARVGLLQQVCLFSEARVPCSIPAIGVAARSCSSRPARFSPVVRLPPRG